MAYTIFDNFEWGGDGDPLDDSGGEIDWTITAAGNSKVEIDISQHYSGTRSARLFRDGSNSPNAQFVQTPISSDQVLRWWWRKGDYGNPVVYHGTSNKLIAVGMRENDYFAYRDTVGWKNIVALEQDRWYLISIRNVNWGAMIYDFYVDGGCIKSSVDMHDANWGNNIVRFRQTIGTNSNTWIDDVGVWNVGNHRQSSFFKMF